MSREGNCVNDSWRNKSADPCALSTRTCQLSKVHAGENGNRATDHKVQIKGDLRSDCPRVTKLTEWQWNPLGLQEEGSRLGCQFLSNFQKDLDESAIGTLL